MRQILVYKTMHKGILHIDHEFMSPYNIHPWRLRGVLQEDDANPR